MLCGVCACGPACWPQLCSGSSPPGPADVCGARLQAMQAQNIMGGPTWITIGMFVANVGLNMVRGWDCRVSRNTKTPWHDHLTLISCAARVAPVRLLGRGLRPVCRPHRPVLPALLCAPPQPPLFPSVHRIWDMEFSKVPLWSGTRLSRQRASKILTHMISAYSSKKICSLMVAALQQPLIDCIYVRRHAGPNLRALRFAVLSGHC